jgi:hypothetical protein
MPRYNREEAETAIRESTNYSEALRRLGLRPAGGNHALFRHWIEVWQISTDHFDPNLGRRAGLGKKAVPLREVMVEKSSYSRAHLKSRLFREGLKTRRCEVCGQGETWRGRRMALILDHINGVPDDHRLENLRILCPNCAAVLDTHCGRKNTLPRRPSTCLHCGQEFFPNSRGQRYCSAYCGVRWDRRGRPRAGARKANRPSHAQLLEDLAAMSFRAVGRKYGVSDNAVRKWLRAYEREAAEGGEAADENRPPSPP